MINSRKRKSDKKNHKQSKNNIDIIDNNHMQNTIFDPNI